MPLVVGRDASRYHRGSSACGLGWVCGVSKSSWRRATRFSGKDVPGGWGLTGLSLLGYGLLVAGFVFMYVMMWLPTRSYQTSSWSFDGLSVQFNGSSPGSAYSGGTVSPLGLVFLIAGFELWRFAGYRSQHYAISRQALYRRRGIFRDLLESWPRRKGLRATIVGRSTLAVSIPPPAGRKGPQREIRWRGLANPGLAQEILRGSGTPAG